MTDRRNSAQNSSNSGKGASGQRPNAVSPARLHQQTGTANSFGGYTKVNHNNGSFSMRKTEK